MADLADKRGSPPLPVSIDRGCPVNLRYPAKGGCSAILSLLPVDLPFLLSLFLLPFFLSFFFMLLSATVVHCGDIDARSSSSNAANSSSSSSSVEMDWIAAEIRAKAGVDLQASTGGMFPLAETLTEARQRARRQAAEKATALLMKKLLSIRLNDRYTLQEYRQAAPFFRERSAHLRRHFTIRSRRTGDQYVSTELAVALSGNNGIYQLLIDNRFGSEEIPMAESSQPTDQVSGLVLDLSHLPQFNPSLEPHLYSGRGRLLYGPQMVEKFCAMKDGLVAYRKDAAHALRDERVGSAPYYAYAAGIFGKNRANIYLHEEDTSRILNTPSARLAMRRCAVIIVIH